MKTNYSNVAATLFHKIMGLPLPKMEYKFHPDRKWRFDVCWPRHMIAVEIDGGIWTSGGHTRGSGYKRDMEKFNHASLLGYRVFHFTPTEVKNGLAGLFMQKVFDELKLEMRMNLINIGNFVFDVLNKHFNEKVAYDWSFDQEIITDVSIDQIPFIALNNIADKAGYYRIDIGRQYDLKFKSLEQAKVVKNELVELVKKGSE